MKKLNVWKLDSWKKVCAAFVFLAATTIALPAQTFTSLARFDRTDGADPVGSLVQGLNGNLYGTAFGAGGRTHGTMVEITGGTLTELHSFCAQEFCRDGGNPQAGLFLATDGNFYGETLVGGLCCGTIFKIDAAGTYTDLYHFCAQSNCADGSGPYGGLIQAADGNFYGTTYFGGANGNGTIFKFSQKDALTTLYSFCAQPGCTDGAFPLAGLVQGSNGNLYGTTVGGGVNNDGTVFEITSDGELTTLYRFCAQSGCADGYSPQSALIEATNGILYGTTNLGGKNGYGTVFGISPAGKLTTLYTFCGQNECADGANPVAGLIQATDGNFYGTTEWGGVNKNASCDIGCGTIFQITPAGTLTVLYSFCTQLNPEANCADGSAPVAGLLQATNGTLYGTTTHGGLGRSAYCLHGCGTVFRLSMGLGPFVKTVPTSGVVGLPVTILGNDLNGATSVTFNGAPATFTVVSSTEITTTVPAGATTGSVQVVTPTSTVASNVPFRVIP